MIKLLTSILFLLFALDSYAANDKPNILVILADDLGYGDVGFTGAKDIFTPRLDQLAHDGVIMKNGYVTHPFCGPSRAGLITGRYQSRFGLDINLTNSKFDMHNGLPNTEQTFAKRLQKSGYTTGIIGKWHLGGSYVFHPNNRGFDYFYGFLSGGHRYFPEQTDMILPLLQNNKPRYGANEGTFEPLMRNNNTGEFNEYLTTALSRDAAKFVSEAEKPFMLYLAYNAPHGPLQAPEKTIAKYSHIKNQHRQIYAAMIDEMDSGIGMVVDALKASGKFDNTLIFFLSDNGGAATMTAANENSKGKRIYSSSKPFRDGKSSMREGGSHVPFFVHWPKGIKKSGTFNGLVSALDIAATAVALGDGDTSGKPLEGKNIIPYLNGDKKGSPHKALFWRTEQNKWAVRTEKSKYLLAQKQEKAELYDMINDPYEKNNIVEQYPQLKAKMANLWNEWNQKNMNNIFLSATPYQQSRLDFYENLYNQLKAKAEKEEKLIIK
ncbi:sulfatase family protein [Thalassotalea sp. PLHSN55]|uniref:sulfatase family protein n=1 Tax=Thalassotalea sp. PLHSN55 TaxID=3435888 RepID=UPI003F848A6E